MAEDLYQTLIRFHREVALPDIERQIKEPLERRLDALRDEMLTNLDAIWKELRDLKQSRSPSECGGKAAAEKAAAPLPHSDTKSPAKAVIAREDHRLGAGPHS